MSSPLITRRAFSASLAAAGLYAAPAPRLDAGFATARETVDALRLRKISASELLALTLRRVDRYNPRLNAIIVEFRERATARARAADEALARRKSWGPLHGLPITIKEAFAYKGSPNTWGYERFKGLDTPNTAVAVERLESAGAIIFGKTNIPVGLADIQSSNPIYGTTNNPWDLSRTCGGSSGGAAAAVAGGLGAISLGSDYGGSIRTPAHLCGIYGHKPTLRLVSVAGHQAGPWDGSPAIPAWDVAGPLARDAADLGLALDVLGGATGEEALAWKWRMPPPRHKRLKDFRIGYMAGGAGVPLAAELVPVYEKLISALAKTGAKLERGWPEGIDPRAHVELFNYLGRARGAASGALHADWLRESRQQLRFRALWQRYFQSHDVFLMPPAATAAFPHNHTQSRPEWRIVTPDGQWTREDYGYWAVFASITGLPATVAPAGKTAAGLPAGIQIVGPMWEDGTPIQFAALLADCAGGFVPPPDYVE